MKHDIEKPDLTAIYMAKPAEARREEEFLAYEAEFDVNRPFELTWSDGDEYFEHESMIYFYKPKYPAMVKDNINEIVAKSAHKHAEFEFETPHFFAYQL